METFSALMAICAGNSAVPGEFPSQRPVTRSFDVFFASRQMSISFFPCTNVTWCLIQVAVSAHYLFTAGDKPNAKIRNLDDYKFVGICGKGCRHYKTNVDIYRDANFVGICGIRILSLS